MFAELIHDALHRVGVDVIRYDATHFLHLQALGVLRDRDIGCVVDIGANTGRWAQTLRRAGYSGRLVSFEPLPAAFEILVESARKRPPWVCHRLAVGAEDGTARLNVAGYAESSSFLAMDDRHLRAAPSSRYIRTIDVTVKRLDTLRPEIQTNPEERLFIKIDVQGFEMEVLRGGTQTLEATDALEVELSLVPLYRGQPLMADVVGYLAEAGFVLVGLESDFRDPETGHTLQVNGLFQRVD